MSLQQVTTASYVLLVAIGALLLGTLLHVPHGPDHWSGDWRTVWFSTPSRGQHERIAIVYITDRTLSGQPYTSPINRGVLARLVSTIDDARPKAIAIDFVFDRATEPSNDADLADALRNARTKAVVVGTLALHKAEGAPVGTTPFERDFHERTGRSTGHLFFGNHHSPFVISDSVVRTRFHAKRHMSMPSFAEAIAETAEVGTAPKSDYISWLKPPADGVETFLTLPAEGVLSGGLGGLLEGKLVLIGGNFLDRDQHLTPFSVKTGERYPGVTIHAQVLAQIMSGRELVEPSWPWKLVIAIGAAAVGFWAGARSGGRHMLVEIGAVIALVAIGMAAFSAFDFIFPYTGTLFAWLAGSAGGHYGLPHHATANNTVGHAN